MGAFKKLNLPNKLTVIRMISVLVIFVLAILDYYLKDKFLVINNGEIKYTWTRFAILGLFLLASYTDHLDGKIARKYNLITTFGKFLDPIADKTLNNSLVIILACFGEINFIVPVLFIIRDIFVDGLRLIASQKNIVLAASNSGKLKTVLQVILIAFCLLAYPLINLSIVLKYMFITLQALTCFISLISGLEYFVINRNVLKEE